MERIHKAHSIQFFPPDDRTRQGRVLVQAPNFSTCLNFNIDVGNTFHRSEHPFVFLSENKRLRRNSCHSHGNQTFTKFHRASFWKKIFIDRMPAAR